MVSTIPRAALPGSGMPGMRIISGLRKAGVELNRKVLADLAIREPEAFAELARIAREHGN